MNMEGYESKDSLLSRATIHNELTTGIQDMPTISTDLDVVNPKVDPNGSTKRLKLFSAKSRATSTSLESEWLKNNPRCKDMTEQFIHLNDDTNLNSKERGILEEIQPNRDSLNHLTESLTEKIQPMKPLNNLSLQEMDEKDDCSVYKRLIRRCHCLNRSSYNDFIIHFNQDTKYRTSIVGEIIKNMRILKRFLYMNGNYTKNALLFLNEGLSESSYSELVEIIEGCTHSDICGIFDEHSIVKVHILRPCKNEYFGDNTLTQVLTSRFLYKLAQTEEGRRYLNFSNKVLTDIRKVLEKRLNSLDFETVQLLNGTLNLIKSTQILTVNYCCKQD